MTHPLLDLKLWDSLSSGERKKIIQEVRGHLPPSFQFSRMKTCRLGTQKHAVAFFDGNGVPFVLIPGGQVILGYDRKKPFRPSPAQRESWKSTQEEYGISLKNHLDYYLTPLREVTIRPFLLEVRVQPVGRAPGSPVVKWLSYRDVETTVKQEGFRLPTSDEWEYACAAGSRTLFRWGDDCPADHYPAGGREKHRFNLHQKPNAFGLEIAGNPYNWEVCAWPDFLRGGDGGSMMCGGAGFLAGWLTLASAYRATDSIQQYREIDEVPDLYLRRAYSLPSDLFEQSRKKRED